MSESPVDARRDASSLAAPAERPRGTVLQVLPALETGGVERGTVEIARALTTAGWGAVVASSGGDLMADIQRANAEHVTLPLASKNPFTIRANIKRLIGVIERHDVDIVHARSRAPAWSAYYAARRTGRPFVTTFHGVYGAASAPKKRYNAVMARGDRVIAISNFIAEHVRGVYGVDNDRLRIVPRGVDLEMFDPANVGASRLEQLVHRWRLPDGMPIIMLPGRLTRWKGQTVLIDALAILGRNDIRCLFVGSDAGHQGFRRRLEKYIARRGLASIVHIADHCRDMPAAYMLADVAVSASLDPEAFGRVIVEAQAMGRPTIATDHGGARETVVPGENGWLVPPGDAAAMAEALREALALDPAERAALALRATERVRATYSKDAMCDRTLAIYDELLAETGRGRRDAP